MGFFSTSVSVVDFLQLLLATQDADTQNVTGVVVAMQVICMTKTDCLNVDFYQNQNLYLFPISCRAFIHVVGQR